MAEPLLEFLAHLGFKVDHHTFRLFEHFTGRATADVLRLGVAITGTTAAMVLGVERIANEFMNLYFVAQRSNTTVGNLLSLGYAAKQVGLSTDEATSAVSNFQEQMQRNPGLQGLLKMIGIDPRGDTTKALDQFIDWLQQFPEYVRIQYAEMYGLSYKFLRQYELNRDKIHQFDAEAKKMRQEAGILPDDKRWDSFWEQLNRTSLQWKVLYELVAQDWAPTATWVLQNLQSLGAELVHLEKEFGQWASGPVMAAVGALGLLLTKMIAVRAMGLGGAAAAGAGGLGALGTLGFLGAGVLGGAALYGYEKNNKPGDWQEFMRRKERERAMNPSELQAERMRQGIDYFMSQGWSREQAIGIMANLYKESKLDPNEVGDSGAAKGIAQWHDERQRGMGTTFEGQLQHVQDELAHGNYGGEALKHATTPEEAAAIFSKNFERPAGGDTEAAERSRMASQISLTLKTDIHVMGGGNPRETASAVADQQNRVTGDAVRYLQGVAR